MIGGFIDLIMFLPLIFLTFSFKRTRKFHTKYEKLKFRNQTLIFNGKSKAKRRFTFPWCFKLVLYAVCFVFMTASIFFTLVKGIVQNQSLAKRYLIIELKISKKA